MFKGKEILFLVMYFNFSRELLHCQNYKQHVCGIDITQFSVLAFLEVYINPCVCSEEIISVMKNFCTMKGQDL